MHWGKKIKLYTNGQLTPAGAGFGLMMMGQTAPGNGGGRIVPVQVDSSGVVQTNASGGGVAANIRDTTGQAITSIAATGALKTTLYTSGGVEISPATAANQVTQSGYLATLVTNTGNTILAINALPEAMLAEGLASALNQDASNGYLANIVSNTGNANTTLTSILSYSFQIFTRQDVTNGYLASLVAGMGALPTGASTAANQVTQSGYLATLVTNTGTANTRLQTIQDLLSSIDSNSILGNRVRTGIPQIIERPSNETPYGSNTVITSDPPAPFECVVSSPGFYTGGYIIKAMLATNNNATTATCRGYVFNDIVDVPSLADGADFEFTYVSIDNYMGFIDFPALSPVNSGSDCSVAVATGIKLAYNWIGSNGSVFVILTTTDGFTPIEDQSFTLTLYGENP